MKYINPFQDVWKKLLDIPIENITLLCAQLMFYANAEKSMQNNTQMEIRIEDYIKCYIENKTYVQSKEDLDKALKLDRMYVFIYENIKAGFIKNKVTKFDYGDEYYTCFIDYYTMLSSFINDDNEFLELKPKYSNYEQARIKQKFRNVKERIGGYINPREVIECFYFSDLGKTFLPLSLVEYLKKKIRLKRPTSTSEEKSATVFQIDKKYIFLNYKDVLDNYRLVHEVRKNDALVRRVNVYLCSLDNKLAIQCGVECHDSPNESQDIAKAKTVDIPKLKSLYPNLPDLPEK